MRAYVSVFVLASMFVCDCVDVFGCWCARVLALMLFWVCAVARACVCARACVWLRAVCRETVCVRALVARCALRVARCSVAHSLCALCFPHCAMRFCGCAHVCVYTVARACVFAILWGTKLTKSFEPVQVGNF